VSVLDDRIDILNRNAADASPVQQVYRTVSDILALVRVIAQVLLPPTTLIVAQIEQTD